MMRPRKSLVALVATLSLLGLGAVAQPTHSAGHRISADRWCC
jgi:hypothetical protein